MAGVHHSTSLLGFKRIWCKISKLNDCSHVSQLLSRSPSHFGLSECKNTSPRRWSLRPGPHSKHGYEVCWTSEAPSKKMWRRGGDPLLECFKWTPFTNGSQEVTTSSNLGFISSPRDRSGCLAADVLGIPNSDVQQARMSESAGCSRGEPNQVTHPISFVECSSPRPNLSLVRICCLESCLAC